MKKIIHVRSLDFQNRKHKTKKKRCSSIIHVSIRASSTNTNSSSVYRHRKKDKASSISIDDQSGQSMNVINKIDKWDIVENNHRKRKKKFSHKKLYLSIFFGLMLCILIAAIIFTIIFPKSKKYQEKEGIDPILRWNKTGITVAGVTGVPGTDADKLREPNGLAFDWSYSLYIADSGNYRVQRYLLGASNGTTVCGQSNGISGSGPSFLNKARKISVTSNKSIYVSDWLNHRVQFWPVGSSSGIMVAGTGISGSALNRLSSPQGISIDENSDTLYVADTDNARVVRYFPNSTSEIVAGVTSCGYAKTQLCKPTGVYFEAVTNSVIISDYARNSVVRWIIGTSEWIRLAGNVSSTVGSSSAELNGPEGIGVDVIGNFYVPDRYNNRIQFFPVGQLDGLTIAGVTGLSGSNASLLSAPMEVIVDNQLNLYVSDTNNHRVQKFLRY